MNLSLEDSHILSQMYHGEGAERPQVEQLEVEGPFVVVNVTRSVCEFLGKPGEHPLLPGEEPHVFVTLDDALDAVAELAASDGHTLETAQIFSLKPVPITDELIDRFEAKKRELDFFLFDEE